MTQREGGPRSPDEPADPAPTDDEFDQADADSDTETLEGEETVLEADEAEDDAVVGDANDALPTSGRRPRTVVPSPGRGPRGLRRPGSPAGPVPAPTPSEIAVRIDDRVSAVFVIVTVAFFILLFIYAVLFGGSGLLTPAPTPRPTPVPTASPSPTASASPSASAPASESAPASGSAAPSAASPSASVAPSVAPSASPSASIAPSPPPSASPSGS